MARQPQLQQHFGVSGGQAETPCAAAVESYIFNTITEPAASTGGLAQHGSF
jgi:hypothetical protein